MLSRLLLGSPIESHLVVSLHCWRMLGFFFFGLAELLLLFAQFSAGCGRVQPGKAVKIKKILVALA